MDRIDGTIARLDELYPLQTLVHLNIRTIREMEDSYMDSVSK